MNVKSRKNAFWIALFLTPVLILFFFYFVYPLGFIFFTSTLKWNGVSTPEFVGLQHFISNFQNKTFLLSIKNNFSYILTGKPSLNDLTMQYTYNRLAISFYSISTINYHFLPKFLPAKTRS